MTTTLLDADGNPPTVRRGETFTFTFPVTDYSVSPTVPKNLTGATEVAFYIAQWRGAQARDLELTLGSGTSHDDTGGNVTVNGTAVQSEALPYGNLWCELWITDSAARRELVGEGTFVVHDSLSSVA